MGGGRQGDVVTHPERLEPDLLGAARVPGRGVRIGAAPAVKTEEHEVQ
jgi:hypothetical protein